MELVETDFKIYEACHKILTKKLCQYQHQIENNRPYSSNSPTNKADRGQITLLSDD